MKFVFQCVLLAGITVTLIYFVGQFALSDILHPDAAVMEHKPWRLVARLAFGAVAVPTILFFMGWFTNSFFRRV